MPVLRCVLFPRDCPPLPRWVGWSTGRQRDHCWWTCGDTMSGRCMAASREQCMYQVCLLFTGTCVCRLLAANLLLIAQWSTLQVRSSCQRQSLRDAMGLPSHATMRSWCCRGARVHEAAGRRCWPQTQGTDGALCMRKGRMGGGCMVG